jgi:hypothetical protein
MKYLKESKTFEMSESEFIHEADDMLGLCINCGDDYGDSLEPDARKVECPTCERKTVYGIEELLLMGRISFVEEEEGAEHEED